MKFNFTTSSPPRFFSSLAALLGGLAFFLPAAAHADRRAYAETYEAVTAPQGELDVEMWSTYARDGEMLNGPPSRGFRNMLELEYGLTSRWDVALYNLLDVGTDDGENGYAGLKLETRYRLAQPGESIVDPIIYFEYQYLRHGDARHKGEVKLILAKDIGRWNVALNAAAEVERLADGSGYVREAEYAFGVSREIFGPSLKLGVEAFGKAEKPPEESTSVFLWAGPAISWASGVNRGGLHGVWVTLGAGRGLTSDSEAWYGRAIVGLQF